MADAIDGCPARRFTLRAPFGRALLGLMALLAVLAAPAAPASGAGALVAQDPGTRQTPQDTFRIAPLEVTVLRGTTDLSRAPYAVSRLGTDDLRLGRSGAFLEDALDLLPGVQVQNRFNYAVGERLSVRGFGARAQFGVRGVKVLMDGIPATMPDGQSTLDHLDLGTLGEAQVLRGPGSALYGNAAGGVLLLRTRIPEAGPLRPRARTVVGSDGLLNATAGAAGMLGSSTLTLNVGRLRYDGFRPHPDQDGEVYGTADRWVGHGQLVSPLGGGLLRVTANGLDLDAENPGAVAADDLAQEAPAVPFSVQQGTGKEVQQGQIGAVWDGPVALPGDPRAELALWGLGRSLRNPIPPTIIDLDRRAAGLRAILGGDDTSPLQWGVGLEAEVQRDDRLNFDNDGGDAGELTLDQEEDVDALGAFVRLGLPLGERVRATGALRWDRFRFEARDQMVGSGDPDDSGTRTMDAWSPTAGLLVDVTPALAVWGNVATALETPTTTELVNRPGGAGGFNPELEPQRSLGLEVGARGRLGDRVEYELVLFRNELDDELVPFEVPEAPGRSFFRNAGSSEHEGWEAAVTAHLEAGLELRGAWSRTDARFVDYRVGDDDFSGNRVPGLSPNRVEGRLAQERTRWYWAVDAEWNDEVSVNDANSEAADAYALLDLRAGLRRVAVGAMGLEVFGGVSNVLDETYAASVTVNAFGGRFYEPGPGRTAYVGLSLQWDRR